MSVLCVSVCPHEYLSNEGSISTKFSVPINGRDSVLFSLRYVMYFWFVDDAIFHITDLMVTHRYRSTGSSVTASSCAANAPAAWHCFRPALEDSGR